MSWNKIINPPYYCPNCGKSYATKELPFYKDMPDCPNCNIMLRTSGSQFVMVGLLVMFVGCIIMCWEANMIGSIVGSGLIIIGITRIINRIRAKRRFSRTNQTIEKD